MDELLQATGLSEKKAAALIAAAQEMVQGGEERPENRGRRRDSAILKSYLMRGE